MYYTSDKDNHSFMNSYVYDIETGEERTLHVGEQGASFLAAVAPDESTFVIARAFANTYVLGYLYDASGNQAPQSLTPDPEQHHVVGDLAYLGRDIVLTTNFDSDTMYLAAFNLDSGEFRKLWELDGVDLTGLDVHEDSRTVFVTASHGVEEPAVHLLPGLRNSD